jgi:hypothetical protein
MTSIFWKNVLKKEHFDVCVDFMSYNTEEFNINSRMILPKVVDMFIYLRVESMLSLNVL